MNNDEIFAQSQSSYSWLRKVYRDPRVKATPVLMLLCCSHLPRRAQRRSPDGWRTWWRCTQLESEMWSSWRAWTCTAKPAATTLKSSRLRPTCTPMRARSDSRWVCWSYVGAPVKLWWIKCGTRRRCNHLHYTDQHSFSSCWRLKLLWSIILFSEHLGIHFIHLFEIQL